MATTEPGFLTRHRTLVILFGMLLFLPPLAYVLQVATGDTGFCGRWCPRMFFVWREGMTGSQFLMGFLRSIGGVILMAAILLGTLFFGRYWCGYFCPVGGATELGSRLLPRSLKIDYSSVPAAPVRYGYLSVYLLAPLFGLGSLCCSYCNFATVPRLFGAAALNPADMAYFFRTAGLINLGLFLFLGVLARGGRAYCNLLCPVGALDALLSRLGRRVGRRVHILSHRCTNCGQCRETCPTWSIGPGPSPEIDHLSCIACRQCQKICPEGAVSYSGSQSAAGHGTRGTEIPKVLKGQTL